MSDMPKWEKAPTDLADRFAAVVDRLGDDATTRRKMFGYPAAFVNGNMATGLFGARWFVRLPVERAGELPGGTDAEPFAPMPGRAMKGYVMVPDEALADDAVLDTWIRAALAFTATLPPK
jgi:TfoX/Sxy family transcriptional regulator of competence genes